jgi:signal transduction histidine kinase
VGSAIVCAAWHEKSGEKEGSMVATIKRMGTFWFSCSIKQALIETLLIGGCTWLVILVFQLGLHLSASGWDQWELNAYVNLLCLSWFLLRVAPPKKILSRGLLKQLLVSFILLVLLHACYVLSMYLLLTANGAGRNGEQIGGIIEIQGTVALAWLFVLTALTSLFHFWNRLRQRSLHWSLIHAHVVVLVSLGVVVGIIFTAETSHPFTYSGFQILSGIFFFVFFLLFFLLSVLLVAIPPLIVFAYLVTRPIIRRVKMLVMVTGELREGRYATRVSVEGGDEIAQLQKNFNAMAGELEKTFRDLQAERDHVASLLQERRELFANVSHELRTPIATLRGYLESDLKNRKDITNSALWADIAVMESEVLQLQERADELFTLSRAEVEPKTLQNAPCNVQQLVHKLVGSYAPLAWRTNKVEIVADMPDEVPLVSADEQRLEQAFKNIVRNALRHTPPGGVIALVVSVEAERVGISIEDTGEGIAADELEHIWERFYRAKSARQGGAGIGLSLVKEWIRGMGGSVEASSTPGEGSCFTLYLSRWNA